MKSRMMVAGLDIATTTGACIGSPGQAPKFFHRDLGKGASYERRFAEALRLCRHLIADHGVVAIGIEAPIIVPKRDNKATNELLMGLVACVRGWAEVRGTPCRTFEVSAIDKHFLGARAKGRAERKRAIMARCQMLGWAPRTADEADAGAVWDIMCAHMSPAYAAQTGLLLSGRVG